MNTFEFLSIQRQKYPQMRCQDALKAVFQAEWGCEHLISDEQGVYGYLKDEWERTPENASCALTEPIGDHFVRLHIAAAKAQGLNMDTLFRMFLHAAQVRCGDSAHFSDMMDCIVSMAREGTLPFSFEEADACIRAYRASGCPAVHHSEAFRQAYHPAYRVIDKDMALLLPVLLRIDRLMRDKAHVIVAIDGRCGSGKTTLAAALAALYHAPVLHMDDFFLQPHQRTPQRLAQPGGNIDAERFLGEVLTPLRQAQAFSYRPFSCHMQQLLAPVQMEAVPLAIVEGSYSMHPLLEDSYDLRIVLTLDPALQKARLLSRDGEAMMARYEGEWIPMEEQYFTATRIRTRCDLVCSTDQNQEMVWSGALPLLSKSPSFP